MGLLRVELDVDRPTTSLLRGLVGPDDVLCGERGRVRFSSSVDKVVGGFAKEGQSDLSVRQKKGELGEPERR